ncbi:peptide-methionine (R)-S-oxide reductase [Hellea sp.]|nr:peptide-methionine (R)-S-oxide reductase [Hellea sp.]
MSTSFSRRSVLASSLVVATTGLTAKAAAQDLQTSQPNRSSDVAPKEADFVYSYRRTQAQWREQLSGIEYVILREGETEPKKFSPLWEEMREGTYRCKGCDLLIYTSDYKVKLNKGWTFFRQSEPDSVLMGIDLVTEYGGKEKNGSAIEVHCRRCGSHFGHMLYIKREILHCINGTSLSFQAA